MLNMFTCLNTYFCYMKFSFSYNKAKVIQALRYHFISRNEIRILMILVNVFAILSAILFYMHKIRPEPFLLSTAIWLLMLLSIWYFLPYSIYKKAATFKDHFTVFLEDDFIQLNNTNGTVKWPWNKFSHFIESPHFFHIYFSARSFFLIPKDDINEEDKHEVRAMLNVVVGKKT